MICCTCFKGHSIDWNKSVEARDSLAASCSDPGATASVIRMTCASPKIGLFCRSWYKLRDSRVLFNSSALVYTRRHCQRNTSHRPTLKSASKKQANDIWFTSLWHTWETGTQGFIQPDDCILCPSGRHHVDDFGFIQCGYQATHAMQQKWGEKLRDLSFAISCPAFFFLGNGFRRLIPELLRTRRSWRFVVL